MMIFILFLAATTSSFVISLENSTFPLLITCNDVFCELDEPSLQNVNSNNLLSNVKTEDVDPNVFLQFTGNCQDNNDCPRLQVCENTGCTSPSLGCTSDSQCFNGDSCLHGLCSNLVTCGQGCTGATVCLDNFCLPPPSTGATSTITPTTTSTSTTTPTTTSTTSTTSTQTSTTVPTTTLPCSTSTSTPSYKTRY